MAMNSAPVKTTGSTSVLTQTHPEYDCKIQKWYRCRDVMEGQDAVKCRNGGLDYLPPTAGMFLDGMHPGELGYYNYQNYKKRSLFYGYYAEGVDLALGMLWNKSPVIEGLKGTPLEYLETKATHEGESIERLLYRVNEAQISTGRIGLLADMPAGATGGDQPYISMYNELSIINWDAGFAGELATESLNLVVLNESGPRRYTAFEWKDCEQYRVLSLGDLEANESDGLYRQGIFSNDSGSPAFDNTLMFAPNIRERTLNEIPFVFINANSSTSCPQDPPMLSLADLVLHLYRLQADYSAELHGQAGATLVTKGIVKQPGDEKKPQRLGAGGCVDLGSQKDADAFYLELSGKGLPALEAAVESAKSLCRERSGEVVDQSSRGRESGNSLEQRISVRTATLHSIAQHAAEGVTRLLKIMARWVGMDDDAIAKIRIIPNTVFAKPSFSGIELKALAESKLLGGVILPYQVVHQWMVARGLTTLSFEECVNLWEGEKDLMKKVQEQVAEGEKMKNPEPAPGPVPGGLAPTVVRPASTGI
jgi:hypothetical protein